MRYIRSPLQSGSPVIKAALRGSAMSLHPGTRPQPSAWLPAAGRGPLQGLSRQGTAEKVRRIRIYLLCASLICFSVSHLLQVPRSQQNSKPKRSAVSGYVPVPPWEATATARVSAQARPPRGCSSPGVSGRASGAALVVLGLHPIPLYGGERLAPVTGRARSSRSRSARGRRPSAAKRAVC
jgi:hypothetical protein